MAFRGFLITCILFVSCAYVTTSVAAPKDKWSMYQGGADHSGFVPRVLLLERSSLRWIRQTQEAPIRGLAVDAERVFTTSDAGNTQLVPLVTLRLDDGEVAWSVNFAYVASLNHPALDNGFVYLQTSDGSRATYLHCYRVDGQFIWRTAFESQWADRYLGPIVVDGSIYFNGGNYGGIYGFDAVNGEIKWYTLLPQYDGWSPTWINGKLLAYTDALAIVDPIDGHLLGTILNPGGGGSAVNQSVVTAGDYAYVTSNGRLVAFDLQQMKIAWAHSLSAIGQVATDGRELFLIAGGLLSVRDSVSGASLWSWVPPSSGLATTNIVVTKSHVMVGDSSSTYLINRVTRQVDKAFPASGKLAYAADTLVIGAVDGFVHAFNLPSDELSADGFD